MERLCTKFAVKIAEAIDADNEKRAVIEYGLIAIFQFLIIFLVSSVIGLIFRFFAESIIIFFSVIFLRKSIGGAHSKDFNNCLIVSIGCIILFSWLSKYIIVRFINIFIIYAFIAIVYIIAYILIYRLAPVDNPNKRITNINKKKRLRKQAFYLMVIYTLLALIMIVLYNMNNLNNFICIDTTQCLSYAMSLTLSVLWQVTMLTKFGHKMIDKIDNLLGF